MRLIIAAAGHSVIVVYVHCTDTRDDDVVVPRTARRCGRYQNYIDQLCNNATAERHTCGQLTCPRAVTECAVLSEARGVES